MRMERSTSEIEDARLVPPSRQHQVRISDGQLLIRAFPGKGDLGARDARRGEHQVAHVIEVLRDGTTSALNLSCSRFNMSGRTSMVK